MEKLREALAKVESLKESTKKELNDTVVQSNTKLLVINNLVLVYIAAVITIGLFK